MTNGSIDMHHVMRVCRENDGNTCGLKRCASLANTSMQEEGSSRIAA
jgi:hypothetical protein